jgi:putative ATP-binding cassette transporter
MKFISFITKYSRTIVILAILTGVVSGIAKAGLIAVVNAVLHTANPASARGLIWSFVALCLAMPVSRFVSQTLLTHLGQKAIFDLRLRLCRQILATPQRGLEEMGSPRIMAVLTDDISAISNTVTTIPVLCMQFAVVLGSLIYMAWLSFTTFLIVFGFIIVGSTIFQLASSRGLRFLRLARDHQDALMKHFRTMLEGTKELKLHRHRRHAFLTSVLQSTAAAYRRSNFIGNVIYAATASFGYQLIFFILLGLLIFVMPSIIQVDTQTLTGFALALFYMLIPLGDIISLSPLISRANIAMDKIDALGLSLTATEADEAAGGADAPSFERLELKGVAHSYHRELENRSFTLGPIDLSFAPGELVFLVGGNGSGKTTLAKLICGLYTPEFGEIRLNSEPVNDQNREAYRQLFSVVFSDFHLFENLLGLETLELDSRAEEYLKQLQLNHKVQITDGTFSTIDLSQGQRKRLALLTSFLENRPFYIFDEWAADQDPVFKEIFYLQLLPELKAKGKTVLVISHDDRYYSLGDRIIKLDYGKIDHDHAVTFTPRDVRELRISL